MTSQRAFMKKVLSISIGVLLLFGMMAPISGALGQFESASEDLSDDLEIRGDTWVIEGETQYLNGTEKAEFAMDNNILIRDGGRLEINDATLVLLIDGFHPWSITLEDGGELALWNSTLKSRGDGLLRPFLKTEVVAHGSTVSLREGSSFSFPGWVRLYDSELMMKDSSFDALEDIPRYDYSWGYGGTTVAMEDNNDCPMLIAEDSEILMIDSEINDYYENDQLERMRWEPSNVGDGHEVGPGTDMEIERWALFGGDTNQMDFPAADYPYLNPIDRISALWIEVDYSVEEEYGESLPLEYRAPGWDEWKTAGYIDEHADDIEGSIWDLDLDQFYRDEEDNEFLFDMDLRFANEATGENVTVTFNEITLHSAYENDMRLENTKMTVINSHIDVDFRPSNVDPRPGYTEITRPDTYLQDSNPNHRVIRVYDDSEFKAYGLEVTGDVSPDGDPAIVEHESTSEIYRWTHIQATDREGTPVEGAEMISDFDEFDPAEHEHAVEYLKNYEGEYDEETGIYTTGRDGWTTMILKSDVLNYPYDWPNSNYVGTYRLEGTYVDEIGEEHTARGDIGLEDFPTITEIANNPIKEMIFDMEVPLPDFNIYEGDLTVDGETEPEDIVVNRPVDVSLDVINEGDIDGEDVLVKFYLDGVDIWEDRIDIDAGQEVNIEFEWTPGEEDHGVDKELSAYVDPYDEIEEYDRMNNELSIIFDIRERPDLRVEEILLEGDHVDNTDVMEGEDVSINVQVANRGETAAEDVYVEVNIDETFLGEEWVSLGPDEELWLDTINWRNPDAGEHEIIAEIDPDNEVDEIDQRYNQLSRDVSVLMRPDLTPEEISFSEDPVRIGETVGITATVSNQGGWTSDEITVHFYVDDEEEPFETVTRSGIEGGASREITVDWTADMTVEEREETRVIAVVVEEDPFETDHDNLEIQKDITVERHRALIVDDITLEPPEVTQGENVRITATVRNVGDMDINEFDINFYSDDDLISERNETDVLRVDDTVDINFIWDTTGEETGERTILIDIPDAHSLETTLTILSPPHLEFISTTWEILDVEQNDWQEVEVNDVLELEEKDDLRFSATIENTGDTPIPNAVLEFIYPDGEEYETLEVYPGEIVEITQEWVVELGDMDEITVLLKPSDDPEVEPYQEISIEVDIVPLQIRITNIMIPEDPNPGETYSFEGTLSRQSDGKLIADTRVRVSIESDGEEVSSGFGTTDSEGEFFVALQIPEEGGEYEIIFEPETSDVQRVEESMSVEDDDGIIPLWLLIVILAAAIGGVGSVIAYFKFYGPKEIVECGSCGASISADSTECPKCGVEFDMGTVKCSECGEWIPSTSESCPECGIEFIKTGEEVEDYTERMRKQYEMFVSQQKREAEQKVGRRLSKKEFIRWWRQQPSFVTFDEWLERKEEQRKKGGQECPNCGSINSIDEAICQKCGTSLIEVEESDTKEKEDEDKDTLDVLIGEEEEEEEEETESEEEISGKRIKKQQKRVKKRPRKKVKKKSLRKD